MYPKAVVRATKKVIFTLHRSAITFTTDFNDGEIMFSSAANVSLFESNVSIVEVFFIF